MDRIARMGVRCAVIGALVMGCGKKDEPVALAPAASSLAPSVAPPTAMTSRFTLATDGKAHIDMPAPIEHIKAETIASAGSLDVDLLNLANTRGEVKVDVQTLATHTFDDPGKDGTQTKHARTWLEVGEVATPEMRDANKWCVFAIRSIDGLSATDVTKVAAEKAGAEDVRTVTLTAHGDFLLHGRHVNKDALLEVKFHYPQGAAPTSKPTSVSIATKAPMHVILAEHDVKPRDDAGKFLKDKLSLFGTKVAETADVTLDLKATPAS